jgi:glycosyltransferase involved in cell wall biosynthesis
MPEKRLVVIGSGPELDLIKKKAKKNTEIVGALSDQETSDYMSSAKAFLFAAEEDFGIAPVEAQAAGTPVIAFARGGVLETVIEQKTGLFFQEQTVPSIIDAVQRFEKNAHNFNPVTIREQGLRFDEERFKKEYQTYIHEKLKEFYANRHPSWR